MSRGVSPPLNHTTGRTILQCAKPFDLNPPAPESPAALHTFPVWGESKMDDMLNLLRGFGAPNWVLFGILAGYFALKELHVLSWFGHKPEKSERELLSMDEQEFRKEMLADRKDLRQALNECDKRHTENEERHLLEMRSCEARYDELSKRFSDFLAAAQAAGLDLLMKIAPANPAGPAIPPVKP